MSLNGKVALVTGSSRGIGAAIATLFAQQGARVVVHGRDKAALRKVQEEITGAGGQAIRIVADITRFNEVEAMRRRIESEYGVVDVLVANAGGSHTAQAPFEQIPEKGWHASIEGNLTATFLTIKSFLPSMKWRGSGSIITLSSAAGRRANGRSPIPYAAAKAGIQILTQHLAVELGPAGIRVNCIAPEAILTERNLVLIPKELQESLGQSHPIRRLGTPEDVAEMALFLASEASSWITGVIHDVAGGAVMV
jgi:3-oxoacyl-[acyl-carrier protein] reductase